MKDKFLKNFVKIFTFLIWALLTVSIIVDFNQGVLWRVAIWVVLFTVSMVIYVKIKSLSLLSNFLISFMILTAILGELYSEFYYTLPQYDKILHFFNTFLIFFVVHDFLRGYFPKDHKARLKYTLLISLSIVIAWEAMEIIFDYFFDSTLVGVFNRQIIGDAQLQSRIEILSPWLDTLYDLILDSVAIFTSVLLIRSHSK